MRFSEPGCSPPAAGPIGKSFRGAALAAALVAAATPACAFFNDRLELFFTETATWDSNVFRLSENIDPRTVTGQSSLRDRILTHGIGISADVPVSLQRFQASYQRFWTRYQKFDHLDFDGDLWRVAWLWAVTREFTGDVGFSETTGLASFATFGGTTQDVIHTRQAYATANWLLTPRWLAYAGLTATERKHDDRTRRINDIEAKSFEARMSYVTPKETQVGLSVRYEDGAAPESTVFQGVDFDNAYRQWGLGIVGRWDATAHSRFDGRVDYVKREYEQFSERDYSGPAWGVTYTWTPSAKLSVASTIRRDIAPIDDVQTAFVISTGVSVKPRWQVTEKVALLGSLDYARWKYQADPIIGGEFEHRIRAASVGFAWTPLQRVVITGNFSREERRSDLANADYKVNIFTLDGRIGF
ncbi:MAG TPA: XrtB/PEP-CTERM-associated polysaccharide biosynthesis outer membrane protein EpsL [Usitatibacter sp.]|nr:XrtB/PEP-CTERM-associated polysaccharide biosynthesis outer membrane protein EpsL [Usitatibacter sp.]